MNESWIYEIFILKTWMYEMLSKVSYKKLFEK